MAAAEQSVTPDAGRSLRDELLAAQAAVNERYEAEDPPEKPVKEAAKESDERPREPNGRFAPSGDKDPAPEQEPARPTPITAEPVAQPAPVQAEFLPAPQGWTNEEKAHWNKVPPEAQQAMLRREKDFSRAVSAQDADRDFAREFKRLTQPYEPLFQAIGATPVQGYQDYLRIAHVLNTGDANAKLNAIQQVAQRYGVPLGAQDSTTPASELPPVVMTRFSQLEAQQQQTRQLIQAWQQQQQQAEMAKTMTDIESFAKDSSHPYFESVREHMATLINGGAATSLQEAYDQAVWARPDIRERLIADQTAPQLKEQQSREKAQKARAKAVGVKGSSGGVPDVPRNPNASVREDLEAAFSEARSRI